MKEKIDFLYHVTMNLETEEKEFIPRIPKYRCKDEDNTIPRVCVCTTLEGAVGAFPYKRYFVNEYSWVRDEIYLTYYKIPVNDLEYKTDEELKELVPDAHITKEHWILNSFKAKPYIIKVNKLTLSNFNKYINEYTGFVDKFQYEHSVENYDRTTEYTYIDKQFFKKAIEFAKSNNISYEIIEDKHSNLSYRRFVAKSIDYKGTTKRYRWIKVKFNIPKGSDMSGLWIVNNKQNDFIIRKNILIQPFKMSKCLREEILYDLTHNNL